MKLEERSFKSVRDGRKTVELRLNDEKRSKIALNDLICFHSLADDCDVVKCRVTGLIKEKDFEHLYEKLTPEEMGYEEGEIADPGDMERYYPEKMIGKYGVLGIRIEKTDEPYLVDGHMHLEYGPLDVSYVKEFVEEAVRKGLDEIDILDHTHRFREFQPCYDHLRKYRQQDEWLHQKTKFCNTLDDYYGLIEEVRKEEFPIRIRFGLEVCYTSNTEDLLKDILKDVKLDFLTGAIHSVDSILYDMPFSDELLWDVWDVDRIFRRYYEEVMSLIRSGLFDRLAHPDQIKWKKRYPSHDLKQTYEEIAKALSEQNMAGENNTGIRYRYGHEDLGDCDELLEAFIRNKVRIITASDAHHPKDVGTLIREASGRIEDAGKSL